MISTPAMEMEESASSVNQARVEDGCPVEDESKELLLGRTTPSYSDGIIYM